MSDDTPSSETSASSSKRPKNDSGASSFPPKGPPFPPGGSYGGPPPPGQFPMQPQPGFPNPMWQGPHQPPPYGAQMSWQQQMPPQGPMYRAPAPDHPPEGWNGYRGPANGDRMNQKDLSNGNGGPPAPFPQNGQRFQAAWPGGQQAPWPQQQWGPGGPPPQMWQQGHPMPGAPGQPMQPMMPPKMWSGGGGPPGAGMRPVASSRPRASPESLPAGFPPAVAMNGMIPGQLCTPVGGRPGGSGDSQGDDDGLDENDDDASKKSRAAKEREKARGSYRCGKCGEPKKGHICPYQPKIQRRPDEPPPETRSAAIQVEMDEFMTLRRLNIEIQGLPESYATAGHTAGSMVVGEPHPYSFDEYASLAVSASGHMGDVSARPVGLHTSPSHIGSVHSLGSQAVLSFGIPKSSSTLGAPSTVLQQASGAMGVGGSTERADGMVTSEAQV